MKRQQVPARRTSLKVAVVLSGLPQWRVAAEIGISESRLSKIISGRTAPTETEIVKISETLGATPAELGLEEPVGVSA